MCKYDNPNCCHFCRNCVCSMTHIHLATFVAVLLTSHVRATQVRLVGGRDQYEGRVEIYRSPWGWGTICDDNFDYRDGLVICKMLGYHRGVNEGVTVYDLAHFGQGSGQILLDSVGCTGLETDISRCTSDGWGSNDCGHHEDVGIRCNKNSTGNGGNFTWATGTLMSPNFPNTYGTGAYCEWVINVATTSTLTLTFSNLTMEIGTACPYDYIEVRDGSTKNSSLLGKYCSNVPAPVHTSGNSMFVKFFSDGSNEYSGFRATWAVDAVCTPGCKNGGTCISDQTCQCPPRAHGSRCQFVCSPDCQNGGTCVANQTCSCPPKVHGKHCEIAVPVCNPVCENGGTCISDQTCQCQSGYYGQWCEAGGAVSAKFRPQLNTTLPILDYEHLMSWYNVPDNSDYNRACYAKIHLQNAALDTLVTAESTYGGQQFGSYSEGPIDAHSQLNGTSRVTCLQVKCPGSSLNGTEMDVHVNVTLTSKYRTCALRNHTQLPGFSQDTASNSFGFTLETEHNYGSTFGVYIGMGFRDKANHIARQSCLSGRRFDLTRVNPDIGVMAELACS